MGNHHLFSAVADLVEKVVFPVQNIQKPIALKRVGLSGPALESARTAHIKPSGL